MKASIEIADKVTVSSREISVEVDLTKLSPEIINQLVIHGLVQKVSDAAAGAKKAAEEANMTVDAMAHVLMTKAVDQLYSGNWVRRTAGEGVSNLVRVSRMVMKAHLIGKKAIAKDADIDSKWIDEKIAAIPADKKSAFAAIVMEKLRIEAENRAARKAMADLDF